MNQASLLALKIVQGSFPSCGDSETDCFHLLALSSQSLRVLWRWRADEESVGWEGTPASQSPPTRSDTHPFYSQTIMLHGPTKMQSNLGNVTPTIALSAKSQISSTFSLLQLHWSSLALPVLPARADLSSGTLMPWRNSVSHLYT